MLLVSLDHHTGKSPCMILTVVLVREALDGVVSSIEDGDVERGLQHPPLHQASARLCLCEIEHCWSEKEGWSFDDT